VFFKRVQENVVSKSLIKISGETNSTASKPIAGIKAKLPDFIQFQ
jgi:hypothetical protein